MSSTSNNDLPSPSDQQQQVLSSLRETNRKVEASLLPAVDELVSTTSKNDGLDFLHVKNSLLLSYLIDLTVRLRHQLAAEGNNDDSTTTAARRENFDRLQEMKTVLDKMRGMDKKLRYQVGKLLQADNAASYATATGETSVFQNTDPLQFRPDPSAMMTQGSNHDDNSGSSSSGEEGGIGDSDDDDAKEDSLGAGNRNVNDDDEDDDDLAAAKQTLSMARKQRSEMTRKQHRKSKIDNGDDDNDAQEQKVYRAPRMTAMPYDLESTAADKGAAKERRQLQKMRASEMAHTLKAQYGDAPEQEDVHGGSEYGRQAQAAKQFAARQVAITKYEEDNMTRMSVSRTDKKEHRRLMRQEGSNLNSIADLGHMVRDASRVIGGKDGGGSRHQEDESRIRHANGKRKREVYDSEGRQLKPRSGTKGTRAKNTFQAALYGGDARGGKSKRKGKR